MCGDLSGCFVCMILVTDTQADGCVLAEGLPALLRGQQLPSRIVNLQRKKGVQRLVGGNTLRSITISGVCFPKDSTGKDG